MIDTYFGANLLDYYNVKVFLFSGIEKNPHTPINLVINDERVVKLDIKKQVFLNGISLYTCYFNEGFKLGNSYKISIENYGKCGVRVDDLTLTSEFDEEYRYQGEDLGVTYTKERTTFKLWAPLASKVKLFLRKDSNSSYNIYLLNREEKGVYSLTLDGDFDNYRYIYEVTNNEIPALTTDPYGKGSTANGKENVVIDFDKIKIDMNSSKLSKLNSYLDSIIYEVNVRDFTIDPSTDIEHKGKFLGFIEENRKTRKGNPAGLDYLKELGVTHVQLLPIYDFQTTDELNPDTTYNWGYDPQQYFAVEGSFSTNPEDGYSRIVELKKMVSKLHENNIRVIMDVVFNHVYNGEFSSFEKVVPNYYFRKKKNGTLCTGSGCGNDFASEKYMARKLILDCCKFWVDEYDLDGFRFDLMGLLDVRTMNFIVKECQKIKPDFMIYGEGWDMNTELNSDQKASILNSFKTPEIGFFNDTYRDTLKGPNGVDKLNFGGYLTGNLSYIEGFKFCYLSSSLDFVYPRRFLNPSQSINYVECHDNFTIFDKVSSIFGKHDLNKVLETIKMINGVILLSQGVPFFHMGQEIGLTKYYDDNPYNKGDKYNSFKYDVLDERMCMFTYLKSMINFKKTLFDNTYKTSEEIGKNIFFKNLDNNLLQIDIKTKNDHDYVIIINPTDSKFTHQFDDYYLMVCSNSGYLKNSDLYSKTAIILPHSLFVFEKKEELLDA